MSGYGRPMYGRARPGVRPMYPGPPARFMGTPRPMYGRGRGGPNPRPNYMRPPPSQGKLMAHPFISQLANADKWPFSEVERPIVSLCRRHRKGPAPPPDMLGMTAHFAATSPRSELRTTPKIEIDTQGTNPTPLEVPSDTELDPAEYALVLLFVGVTPDGDQRSQHLHQRISFVVTTNAARGGATCTFGGAYDPTKDGKACGKHIVRTAIRSVQEQLGIDISNCKGLEPFAEFQYSRSGDKSARAVYFVVDATSLGATTLSGTTREEIQDVTEETESKDEEGNIVKTSVTKPQPVQVPYLTPKLMTLAELLRQRAPLVAAMQGRAYEEHYELGVIADNVDEMIQRDFGNQVVALLKEKKAEYDEIEESRKRKRLADIAAVTAKRAKIAKDEETKAETEKDKEKETEEGKETTTKTEEEGKEKKEGEVEKEQNAETDADANQPETTTPVPKKMQTKINQDIVDIFQYFDRGGPAQLSAPRGHLPRSTLEALLYAMGNLCRNEIDGLLTGIGLQPQLHQQATNLYYTRLAAYQVEIPDPPKEEPKEGDTEMTEAATTDNKEGEGEPTSKATDDSAAEETQDSTGADVDADEPADQDAEETTGGVLQQIAAPLMKLFGKKTQSTAEPKPTATEVKKMVISDLKAYCEKNGLPATGKKGDLQKRVLEYLEQ